MNKAEWEKEWFYDELQSKHAHWLKQDAALKQTDLQAWKIKHAKMEFNHSKQFKGNTVNYKPLEPKLISEYKVELTTLKERKHYE